MDAEELEFKDETFDIITCCELLEHVKDPRKAIEEAIRVAKVGASLYFTTPIGYNYDCPEHIQHFELIDIINLFRGYHYELCKTRNYENEIFSLFAIKVLK